MADVLRDREDVRTWVAEHVYAPVPDAPVRGRVGLEAEFFPFWLTGDGRPAARLALVELMGIVDGIPGAVRQSSAGNRPTWLLDGALITEEPGAQIEVAGPPEVDASTAIANLERVVDALRAGFRAAGAALAAAGLDCWSAPGDMAVQLEVPRYRAMTAYFSAQGGDAGHLLMCASCSVQVNIDLGPPAIAADRWLLANLASPVFTAAFAASPRGPAVNGRSLGWRELDPTRTGVAPSLAAGSDDPVEHATQDALRASVMMVARDDAWHDGTPGWTFGHWVDSGHERFGPPTTEDLRIHLTTLFPENRLRGFLEVRGVDALPRPWRAAAVALVVGLLYDEEATARGLAILAPHRVDVADLLRRAAHAGLADPVVGPAAVAVLGVALEGARRLDVAQVEDAEAFLQRFTCQGRHPSDDLRAALADSPAAALAWAAERSQG